MSTTTLDNVTDFENDGNATERASNAGYFTRFKDIFKRKKPAAGSPENVQAERTEPYLDTQAAADAVAAEEKAKEKSLKKLLNQFKYELSRVWGQDDFDDQALMNISHLRLEDSLHDGAAMFVNENYLVNDQLYGIYTGYRPSIEAYVVEGNLNITAEAALDQALVAMTNNTMREKGIDEVTGTELDKALLCLAAQKAGLKINNLPTLSDEVKAQAAKMWKEAFPEEVAPEFPALPVAEQTVGAGFRTHAAGAPGAKAAPAQEPKTEDNKVIVVSELIPADQSASPKKLFESKAFNAADIIDVDPLDIKNVDNAAEANKIPEVIYLGHSGDDQNPEEDATIPTLTQLAAMPAQEIEVKPAAQAILKGEKPEDSVDQETFVDFVKGLKTGAYSNKDGFIDTAAVENDYNRPVRGTTEGAVLLQATEAQGVLYAPTVKAEALALSVNPHKAGSPSATPRAWEVKPEAATVLKDHNISTGDFKGFVDALKVGRYSDEAGRVDVKAIQNDYSRDVNGVKEADILLKAAEAQSLFYTPAIPTTALRMVVNPHVVTSSVKPAMATPKVETPEVLAANDTTVAKPVEQPKAEPKAEAEIDEPAASLPANASARTVREEVDSILASAGISAEKYQKIKTHVEKESGKTFTAGALVEAFANEGVGSNRANKLVQALKADNVPNVEVNRAHQVRSQTTGAKLSL